MFFISPQHLAGPTINAFGWYGTSMGGMGHTFFGCNHSLSIFLFISIVHLFSALSSICSFPCPWYQKGLHSHWPPDPRIILGQTSNQTLFMHLHYELW